jgi:predicted nucleotidyltransferase
MKTTINKMVEKIKSILQDNFMTFYIYGSIVSKDYRHGWSDIDFVCFTYKPIREDVAEQLLMLRQNMLKVYPKNKYFRKFEGIFTSLKSYINDELEKIVYWGTKGQRIKDRPFLDVFAQYELKNNSIRISGVKLENQFVEPSFEELKKAIDRHYNSIREHAVVTDESLYSCGWLLDISRCLYTLKYQRVISKTKAAEWALKNNLCPFKRDLKKTLKIRKNPLRYKDKKETKKWLSSLGNSVQQYANILEKSLIESL